jgi:hypothetical protein
MRIVDPFYRTYLSDGEATGCAPGHSTHFHFGGFPSRLSSESDRGYSHSAASAPFDLPADCLGDGGCSHISSAFFPLPCNVIVCLDRGGDLDWRILALNPESSWLHTCFRVRHKSLLILHLALPDWPAWGE